MGLGMCKDNPYHTRRLMVRELVKLPKSFITRANMCDLFGIGSAKAGAFLVNTGVIALNLRDYDWCKMAWPGFCVRDRIVWSANGVPRVYTEPEDWFFSRWLWEHRLHAIVTRELSIHHFGEHTYRTDGEWGLEQDNGEIVKSPAEWESMNVAKKTDQSQP